MGKKVMLTTVDNPYDPFDEFREWYDFDTQAGYHSCSLLARIALNSNQLSEADQDLAVEMAVDEIVEENVTGVFRKVEKLIPDEGDNG